MSLSLKKNKNQKNTSNFPLPQGTRTLFQMTNWLSKPITIKEKTNKQPIYKRVPLMTAQLLPIHLHIQQGTGGRAAPYAAHRRLALHTSQKENPLSSFLSKNNSQIICSKTRLFWFLLFKMQSPSEALDKPTLFGKRMSTLLSSTVKWFILKLMELSRINCIYCIH